MDYLFLQAYLIFKIYRSVSALIYFWSMLALGAFTIAIEDVLLLRSWGEYWLLWQSALIQTLTLTAYARVHYITAHAKLQLLRFEAEFGLA